jgi:hypothetical protein
MASGMNRGDYETLSAAIADSDVDRDAKRALAFDIADALTGTSERFDPVLWLRQCEIGQVEPVEVAGWTKRLELRVLAIARKRRGYEERTGNRLERY